MKTVFSGFILLMMVTSISFAQSNTTELTVLNITQHYGAAFDSKGQHRPELWIEAKDDQNKTYILKYPYFEDFTVVSYTWDFVPSIVAGNILLSIKPGTKAELELRYENETYLLNIGIGTIFSIIENKEGGLPSHVFDGNWIKKGSTNR
jgi:hypothetical protein